MPDAPDIVLFSKLCRHNLSDPIVAFFFWGGGGGGGVRIVANIAQMATKSPLVYASYFYRDLDRNKNLVKNSPV